MKSSLCNLFEHPKDSVLVSCCTGVEFAIMSVVPPPFMKSCICHWLHTLSGNVPKMATYAYRDLSNQAIVSEMSVKCSIEEESFLIFIQEFMIQGGDPTGTGRGGSSIYGYW